MANMTWWRRPTNLTLRRDMEDILDEFDLPRGFRREIERLFAEDLSPRTMWAEMDRIFDDFVSPPTLRRRIARLFEPVIGSSGRALGGARARGSEGTGSSATSRGMGRSGEMMFAPQIELTERDNTFVIRVDLPGVREQDVNVRVDDDDTLTISGERHREETRRERGYEYTERSYGTFMRSIELPNGADTSRIEADFRNGVLEVHVPKGESARTRQVPIRGREREREVGPSGRDEPRVLETPGDGGRRDKAGQNANATK
jgi:HSP20 family protein